MHPSLLQNISQPSDLKRLNSAQIQQLCGEIRQFLLDSVSKTGGHLASNLGAVELTVALHRIFETPRDAFVFDVGHQCYTHKLLTGRYKRFGTLRQLDGLSGFPNPNESVHDAFIAGHGNTALSVAIGIAWAKKLKGEPGHVVAIIGDGAFTGGMVYEGMNNIGRLDNLMVILNDNKMSISHNVGALAGYLGHLRTTTRYFTAKENVNSFLSGVPLVGTPIKTALQNSKKVVRRAMYHSTIFEDMGFHYFGLIDGHNEPELERILQTVCAQPGPTLLHVVTKKGKGYAPAESNPGNYHGVSKFDLAGIPDPEIAPAESFSNAFGRALSEAGDADDTLCAITAAMKYGTGLQFFSHAHPERFFDVGMAEQHAVTFAAGLASKGMLPVVCIYSTFLQRSYDQIIHDVSLLRENVVFAVDRAGFVPGDGETHQGIYDPAFLSQVGMPIYSPSNYEELRYWLAILLRHEMQGPRAIRYPRGGENTKLAQYPCTKQEYDFLQQLPGAEILLVSYADELEDLLDAADQLNAASQNADVLKLVKLYPFTGELIDAVSKYKIVLFAEECVAAVSIWLTLCSKTAGMAAFCTVLSAQPACPMQPSRRSSNAPVWMLRILCRQSGLPSRKEKTSCENSVGPISCAERTCAEPGARQSFDHGRCGFCQPAKSGQGRRDDQGGRSCRGAWPRYRLCQPRRPEAGKGYEVLPAYP